MIPGLGRSEVVIIYPDQMDLVISQARPLRIPISRIYVCFHRKQKKTSLVINSNIDFLSANTCKKDYGIHLRKARMTSLVVEMEGF